MEIEVLGVGCPKCARMYEAVVNAVELAGLEAQVREQETFVNDYVNVLMRGYESSFLAAARAVLKEQD